jgi:uncharacterized protein
MAEDHSALTDVSHRLWERVYYTGFTSFPMVLYFGDWTTVPPSTADAGGSRSNTQYNAFEFTFRGSVVRWIGQKAPNHGQADVYLDGEFQELVDTYAAAREENAVLYQKDALDSDVLHTLRVVVRKERNPNSTDCFQEVSLLQAENPVIYPLAISNEMAGEYAEIQSGTKEYLSPESWRPVDLQAVAPNSGVKLLSGPLGEAFSRNIRYLNHSFASPTFCDGKGWSEWLPASNEGRLLQGAGSALRWDEREDMRTIVNTLVDRIEARMRDDGYYNYYEEADSYALDTGINSERKNYDRVFWTRGLLTAGMAGNEKAYGLLRRMYDWFNASPYLPRMLLGGNATNGLPGGPLVYHSPVGKDDDLVTTLRFYDQDYWMRELASGQPLSLTYYPGERPHCYDLLGIEAFVDEYRATGAQKYLDAVRGAWEIYRENFKHIGGATAIMESQKVFPPKSYYFANRKVGETCGSVFWININSKLLHLYPEEEKYAAEIEEALFNVNLANQDDRGYIRYHTHLEGAKSNAGCQNTCCEVSSAGLLSRLPEFVYSIAPDGLYVNLFAASEISWTHDGKDIALTSVTDFPHGTSVRLTVSNPDAAAPDLTVAMKLHIRVPGWATSDIKISVNGYESAAGTRGSYVAISREWRDGDRVEFDLPTGFSVRKYTGFDQIEGNLDRYALLYGPVLMALAGDLEGPGGVPRLIVLPEKLPGLLRPVPGSMDQTVEGQPGYVFKPYWELTDETFTCFPIIEA